MTVGVGGDKKIQHLWNYLIERSSNRPSPTMQKLAGDDVREADESFTLAVGDVVVFVLVVNVVSTS
jgi:hypothetical protein